MLNRNTSKQNISQICHHLLHYSKPRKGGSTIWYVLNNTEFNDGKLTSRKIFWKYKDELIRRRLIKKIKSIHDRGEFYTITPVGIFQIRDLDWVSIKKIFEVLEPFAKKPLFFKSEIFGNEKIDFGNFWEQIRDSLPSEGYLIDTVERILKNSIIDEKSLLLRLEIFALSSFVLTVARFDFEKDKILIDELGLESWEKINEVNEELFFQYLTRLLFCLIVFSTAHEYFAEEYYMKENFSSRKITGNEKKFYPPHLKNENLTKIIYLINHVVESRINEIYEQNEGFSKILSKMQFELKN